MPGPVLIEAAELSKSFSGVPALRGAALTLAAGEVLAVMGENGAGKSTLMRILSGALPQDSGTVTWHGKQPATIGMVHQEAMLAPHLTVAENLFLGREPMRSGLFIDNRGTVDRAARYLAEHRLQLDPEARVGGLNAAQKQMLELARALRSDPELLILDEPTSSLSETGSKEVLRIVEDCRERGKGILYISHRFEEVRRTASRVLVLRDGAAVFTGDIGSLSDIDLVKHMAGHVPAQVRTMEDRRRSKGEALLHWKSVTVEMTLHAGEIVGLAGLMGAGRTELCESLFGARPPIPGQLELLGKPADVRSPRQALRAGLVYLSEDRQHYGILQGRGLRENITIAKLPVGVGGWLQLGRERDIVTSMVSRLAIKGSPQQPIQTLSGGNQQKGLLARWLLTQARVFLLDEPTRGIDVNAKEEVFALMEELAGQGAAILMVSSEIPELLRMCDRLLVMRDNRIVRELDAAATSREEVLHWAL